MQSTNQHRKPKSRCVFCSSTDYGKGCRFGPHGVHFHPDDSTKCSYCGSPDYGKGCRINPTGNIHVHGGVYNNMYREAMQNFLDNKILIRELKKSFTEFQCYALGIIDKDGNKIKQPVTEAEQLSYTPAIKTLIKIKKYLGSKVDLLDANNLLESVTKNVNESIEHYKKILSYQDKIETIVNELYRTLDEAQQDGLPIEDIKRILNT